MQQILLKWKQIKWNTYFYFVSIIGKPSIIHCATKQKNKIGRKKEKKIQPIEMKSKQTH